MKTLLYKPLSFKGYDPNNIFVWSDLHLGHNKEFIYKPRGFDSVEEHDAALRQRWQTHLNPESMIFILGDIMFGHRADERLLSFFQDVPFKICFLMGGNHHAGFKQLLEDTNDNLELFLDVDESRAVQFLPNYVEAYIGGLFYVMCHYPIISANRQGKHDFGGMIHGHCHGNLRRNDFAKQIYKNRVLDVGVECMPSPVSFREIRRVLDDTANKSYDHH